MVLRIIVSRRAGRIVKLKYRRVGKVVPFRLLREGINGCSCKSKNQDKTW